MERCYRGFCIPKGTARLTTASVAAGAGDAAQSVAHDAGDEVSARAPEGGAAPARDEPPARAADPQVGQPCRTSDMLACYTGPAGTAGYGECRAGMRRCECPPGAGCEDGSWGPCLEEVTPVAERCNGKDDDCDQAVDEGTDVPCYAGPSGCELGGDGLFDCHGLCRAGAQRCVAGELGDCEGQVVPSEELCSSGSQSESANEDCDDRTDEGCACSDGESHSCYDGPSGTVGVGRCRAGSQRCSGGAFGACEGQVKPQPESCDNDTGSDDDCDGHVDEISGRGAPCSVPSKKGRCAQGSNGCADAKLVCVTPTPTAELCNGQDDDCDGAIDEDFDLQADPQNCGSCGAVCRAGSECCSGSCVDTQSNPNACGDCSNRCNAGLACCGGRCTDLQADMGNCGACGTDCQLLGLVKCCRGSCSGLLVCL